MASSLTAISASTAAAISITTVVGSLAALPHVAIATRVVGVISSKIGKLYPRPTKDFVCNNNHQGAQNII